jgi:hypothetical protein
MSSKSTPDPEKEIDGFVCPTASMCSTPLEPDGKQHVSDLFKKMGSKYFVEVPFIFLENKCYTCTIKSVTFIK